LKLVGIDLATEPRTCGVCVTEGRTTTHVGHGYAEPLHPSRLLEHCSGADAVGIDVPFGWPVRFIEALCSYEIGKAFDRERRL
jgi:predicted nuclease with RNAse H fold